ncbi:hypothetical protein WJX77_012117 [Trebouxia sp. C0004]
MSVTHRWQDGMVRSQILQTTVLASRIDPFTRISPGLSRTLYGRNGAVGSASDCGSGVCAEVVDWWDILLDRCKTNMLQGLTRRT